MFKKLLFAAVAAALTTAPAFATTYSTTYSSNIGLLVPVACNFLMPAESFGAISYGLGTAIDADQVLSGGTCNVPWTPVWSDANTGKTASGNTLEGQLNANPNNAPNLAYDITFGSAGGLAPGSNNPANTIVGGTIHFHMDPGQSGLAQGAHTYSDILLLAINY